MPEVFMPRLSDTMTEGTITEWLKHEGDEVHKGDVLAEIETDKATMELEAYDEGVLERVLVDAGNTVPIGTPIAQIGDGSGAAPPEAPARQPAPAPAPQAENGQPAGPATPAPSGTPRTPAQPDRRAEQEGQPLGPVRTSPLARAIARRHGIDLASIRGSGPAGRIVRADVEAAVAAREEQPHPAAPAPQPQPVQAGPEDEEIALTAVRRVTARRLSESATVPHFDLVAVVDAQPLLAFRADVNRQLADGKVSVTDLLVRACALALRAHPQLNASWGGDKILRHKGVHIGIAVALDDGLIVPVVRDADRKSVREIAAESRDLAGRARAGRLTPDEFTGGTFTISNLGMYGIDHFTAVINPPEAAILAVGAATPQPVVRDGELVAGTTMTLTLSIDHRVSDGATGALFLAELRGLLEQPLRIVV